MAMLTTNRFSIGIKNVVTPSIAKFTLRKPRRCPLCILRLILVAGMVNLCVLTRTPFNASRTRNRDNGIRTGNVPNAVRLSDRVVVPKKLSPSLLRTFRVKQAPQFCIPSPRFRQIPNLVKAPHLQNGWLGLPGTQMTYYLLGQALIDCPENIMMFYMYLVNSLTFRTTSGLLLRATTRTFLLVSALSPALSVSRAP